MLVCYSEKNIPFLMCSVRNLCLNFILNHVTIDYWHSKALDWFHKYEGPKGTTGRPFSGLIYPCDFSNIPHMDIRLVLSKVVCQILMYEFGAKVFTVIRYNWKYWKYFTIYVPVISHKLYNFYKLWNILWIIHLGDWFVLNAYIHLHCVG